MSLIALFLLARGFVFGDSAGHLFVLVVCSQAWMLFTTYNLDRRFFDARSFGYHIMCFIIYPF